MELVVLGSGWAFASAARGQAGYLLRHGGTSILVDAGPGTVRRLVEAGQRPESLDAVFFTHWHPDHVTDLVPLLFEIKHASRARGADLPVHGPPGFGAVFDGLMSLFGQWCVGEGYEVEPMDVERERVEIDEMTVTAFPVWHGVPAVGYRVEAGGRVVALTGDTGPCEMLEPLARGADVLVAEATNAADDAYAMHLNARQAGELATRASAGHLVLTHLSPSAEAANVVGDARAAFEGPVTLASDRLVVTA